MIVFGDFHIPGPDSFSGPSFSGPDLKNAEYEHFFRSVRNTPKIKNGITTWKLAFPDVLTNFDELRYIDRISNCAYTKYKF